MSPESNAATVPLEQLVREAEQLRAHPAFAQAVRAYAVGLARFREAPRIVNKLTASELRFRVTAFLMFLSADHARFGPGGGATYGRMLALCTRRDEVSPRVLKTTLALLRLLGFVEVRRSTIDARSKIYRPTARMAGFLDMWLGYAVTALDVLEPEMRRTDLLREDPGFIDRFFVSAGRDYTGTDTAFPEQMPEFVSFFGAREGATQVMLGAMEAEANGTATPSRATLAHRFGLSKTQVATVVGDGVTLGFWTLDAAAAPVPTARLHEVFGRWIALELAFYARHMQPADALPL